MADIVHIPVPLPHIRSVNTWLLLGEPLTLVDTGPLADDALDALEAGLRRAGVRLEDLEQVLLTHHHLDHTGLAATIAARSGASIAALDRAAAYGERYFERSDSDRSFSLNLMRHHGVPDDVIEATEDFWEMIRSGSEPWHTDRVLQGGDVVRAGDRDLRVIARPGHSTTDTLFVDEAARLGFVGDHLLRSVSSNTEIYPAVEPDGTRPRARVAYLESLRLTAAMPLDQLLSGHGDPITGHAQLVEERFAEHRRRCDRILAVLAEGPASAYEIATHLWSPRTVLEHLDLLLDGGSVTEHKAEDGSLYGKASFALSSTPNDDPGGGGHAAAGRYAHRGPRR